MALDDLDSSEEEAGNFAELILAKARFHRVLFESFDKRVKNERGGNKKRSEEVKRSKEKNYKEKKRNDEKKRRKAKKDGIMREKAKCKSKIGMVAVEEDDTAKKEKHKAKKEKDKDKDRKKKHKSKKKRRSSKTIPVIPPETVTIEISDDDPGHKSWWSFGPEENHIEEDKKKKMKKKKTKAHKKKKKKQGTSNQDILKQSSTTDLTEHSVTEHTTQSSLGSSFQWSLSSPIVRKLIENCGEDDTNKDNTTLMWWDMVEDIPPSTPTYTPTSTPASTPTMFSKRRIVLPRLLAPYSDDSESDDYENVSLFSEESLSEQILDDLSDILDCCERDDSENDFEKIPIQKKKSMESLGGKSYDSSSICSSISPLRKLTTFTELDSVDQYKSPNGQRHLGGVKILGSRPSPYGKKWSISPYTSSPVSPGASSSSSHSPSRASSRASSHISQSTTNSCSSGSHTSPSANSYASSRVSPRARYSRNSSHARPRKSFTKIIKMDGSDNLDLDGITMVRSPGLFSKSNVHLNRCLPSTGPLA